MGTLKLRANQERESLLFPRSFPRNRTRADGKFSDLRQKVPSFRAGGQSVDTVTITGRLELTKPRNGSELSPSQSKLSDSGHKLRMTKVVRSAPQTSDCLRTFLGNRSRSNEISDGNIKSVKNLQNEQRASAVCLHSRPTYSESGLVQFLDTGYLVDRFFRKAGSVRSPGICQMAAE